MMRAELRAGGLALMLAALVACNKGSPTSPNAVVAPGKKGEEPKNGESPLAKAQSSADFARSALAAIEKETLPPEAFDANFLKVLARPLTEEGKQLGYNAVAARAWIGRQAGTAFKVEESMGSESAGASGPESWGYIKGAVGGDKPGRFGLFVVGRGKVAWFYRTAGPTPTLPATGQVYPPLASGVAFVECLLGGEFEIAEALMTTPFKASLADPFGSDKDIGYNPAKLRNVVLNGWKSGVTGCKVTKQVDDGKTSTLSGELTNAGGGKPFTLTLTLNTNGLWLVSEFKEG